MPEYDTIRHAGLVDWFRDLRRIGRVWCGWAEEAAASVGVVTTLVAPFLEIEQNPKSDCCAGEEAGE
jgi:hypothetical protein